MKNILSAALLLPLLLHPQNYHDSVMISLERTLCYGECPAYTVTIWGGGTVEFQGTEFVNTVGLKTYTIDKSSVDSLVREILAIDFFSLNDSYISERKVVQGQNGRVDTVFIQVTDLPTQYVTAIIGNRKKTVEDYHGAPPVLKELEKKIDGAARTSLWVRGK